MVRPTRLRPALLTAPDEGFPGIPGAGPTGSSGAPDPAAAQAAPASTPHFAQPAPPTTDGPVTYELSGWWRRVGAQILDGIIVGVIASIIARALGIGVFTASGGEASVSFANADFLGYTVIAALVALAYVTPVMLSTGGSTLGKLVTGIRVVRADGEPLTFGVIAVRESVLKWGVFALIWPVELLDYLWPLWDGENRALHDMIVKTRVVRR